MGIFHKSEKGVTADTAYATEGDAAAAPDPVFGEVVQGGQK